MSTNLFKKTSIVLLALNFIACSLLTPDATPIAADIEKEEQSIYSFFISDTPGVAVILLDTSTNISSDDPQQTIDYINSGLPNASKETLDNYLERNRRSSQLSSDMQLGVDYILLSTDDLSTIMRRTNGWNAFYEKYSHSGYTQFSRVGFNNSLDQAMVYVGQMAGPLMGNGFYYLMEKKDGQWVIKEQVMVWIS
ncbi:MAG: hypothetical protein HY863_03035 [Chloroflexi bacterium]|nr:hypothetical protein [Chloroflexota bacterium]